MITNDQWASMFPELPRERLAVLLASYRGVMEARVQLESAVASPPPADLSAEQATMAGGAHELRINSIEKELRKRGRIFHSIMFSLRKLSPQGGTVPPVQPLLERGRG